MAPQAVLAADTKDFQMMLRGKIEEHDKNARIKRPDTPALNAQATDTTTAKPATKHKASVDVNDFNINSDFNKKFAELNPFGDDSKTAAPEAQAKAAQTQSTAAEDDALVIAWEAWHKRVCQAIFEHWQENSQVWGVAHTTIVVTRDHHMSVTIHDVALSSNILTRLTGIQVDTPGQTEDEFRREVEQTVSEVNGNQLLEFPERSQRQQVEFEPYFSKVNEASGYDWNKNDYEVVPGR